MAISLHALLGDFYLVISAKTKFQLSPVEHLKRVKKLSKNPVKFALFVSPSGVYFTKLYKFIPKTLYKNRTKNNSPPILPSAGKVIKKVANIILKLLALLINFKTLAILKVRIILVADPILLITSANSKTTPTKVKITTTKSKLFQGSEKYNFPNDITFNTASTVKITKNE